MASSLQEVEVSIKRQRNLEVGGGKYIFQYYIMLTNIGGKEK
jgi:hypothetical protein